VAAVLALLASVGFGAGDFLGGMKARRIQLMTVLVISQLGALGLAIVAVAAVRPDAPTGSLVGYAAAAGFFQATGLGAYWKGLSNGAMGVVAPISATAAIIPVTVGLTRGEHLDPHQAVGIAVALIGVMLTSTEPRALSVERPRIAIGVGYALVAAVCLGSGLACIGLASEGGDITWVVLVSRIVLVGLLCATAVAIRHRLDPNRGPLLPLLLIGLLSAGSTFLFAEATTRGLISVVAVIVSVYPVTTIGLAWLVLGERVAWTQRLGAAVALAGVALIAA
jgi:drug/metabolite transporter (DMT)-like permease